MSASQQPTTHEDPAPLVMTSGPQRFHWLQPAQCTSLQFLADQPDTAVAGCSDGTLRLLHPDGRTTIVCHVLAAADDDASKTTTTTLSKLPVLVATAGRRIFASLARGSKACVAVEWEPQGLSISHVFRHADAKLRGLGAAQQSPDNDTTILLTGLGIQNLHVYRFATATNDDNKREASWQCLLDTPTNGNTLRWLSFGTSNSSNNHLQAYTHSNGHVVQVWDLEDTSRRPRTVPDTQECLAVHANAAYCTVRCLPHVVHVVPLLETTTPTVSQELCLPLLLEAHDDSTSSQRTSRRRRRPYRSITHVTAGSWCHVSDGSIWHGPTGRRLTTTETTNKPPIVAATATHVAVATDEGRVQMLQCSEDTATKAEETAPCEESATTLCNETPAAPKPKPLTKRIKLRKSSLERQKQCHVSVEPTTAVVPVREESSSATKSETVQASGSNEGPELNDPNDATTGASVNAIVDKNEDTNVFTPTQNSEVASKAVIPSITTVEAAVTKASKLEAKPPKTTTSVLKEAPAVTHPTAFVVKPGRLHQQNADAGSKQVRHPPPVPKKNKSRKTKKRIQPESIDSPPSVAPTTKEQQLPSIIPPPSTVKATRSRRATTASLNTNSTITPAKRPALAVLVSNTKDDVPTTHKKKRRRTDWSRSPPCPSPPPQHRTPLQRLETMAATVASPRDSAGRWAQAVVAAVRDCLRHDPGSYSRVVQFYRERAAILERRLELEAVCRRRTTTSTRVSVAVWCHTWLERVQVVVDGGEDPHEEEFLSSLTMAMQRTSAVVDASN